MTKYKVTIWIEDAEFNDLKEQLSFNNPREFFSDEEFNILKKYYNLFTDNGKIDSSNGYAIDYDIYTIADFNTIITEIGEVFEMEINKLDTYNFGIQLL